MNTLILASASSIRADLLRRCSIGFDVVPARVDEAAVKAAMRAEGAPARDIVDALADVKALRVAQKHPDRFVLGADQILALKERLFDKPASLAEAAEHLRDLRGQTHVLLSAAVIYHGGRPVWRHVGTAQLTMRPFSDRFLDKYLARHGDDLLATVGCYKLEEDGPTLFSQIRGDYFSVLGLPLLEVLGYLRTREVAEE